MLILALDISSRCTGWAVYDGISQTLTDYGAISNYSKCNQKYPFNYLERAEYMAKSILQLIVKIRPSTLIIEETNQSKSRYTQKLLEFVHCLSLYKINVVFSGSVYYVNTSTWRNKLNVELTKSSKDNNKKLSKLKQQSKVNGRIDRKRLIQLKKQAGIKGKVTKKHVAIDMVNQQFKLNLKQKDNDIAEAILLGLAFCKGVSVCDGKDNGKHKCN